MEGMTLTPEERASEILSDLHKWDDKVERIANVIRAAVADEREACALIADNFNEEEVSRVWSAEQHIAAAIRKRGK